ncbi:hypothetical protein H7347_07290 [Corynebacterium sp. zg-331]|uniref:hypothetical protein n=1 Tax=unclassified Corynebacterium TaxID=2624378 RepID=UPI00128B46D1|nr:MULTISPECIES: hypothetical protein [unclassified Corynebacterium]MBC3186377.1 hypothetical protein [Corynebacterium sp. zg-331]MPV52865.1 hypothetical protein [Corynebacterium sp. zg331]
MPKCLRVGCPRPRAAPDHEGLGLCLGHYRQLHAGTIGADHNPRVREYPVEAAAHLIETERRPGERDRALARRLGIPKDTIHHVRHRHWPVLRSATWEELAEAIARAQHARLQADIDLGAAVGEQMPLWP